MHYDIAIVGGGINGAGIAADAAGRGLKVLLLEQQDLASATSSWSSKLIHGGLRYLEHYEFRLVKEALAERDVLLNKAPHIIDPLQFILPHHPGMRPTWMLKAGLFLYDNLTLKLLNRSPLSRSESVNLNTWVANPLLKSYSKGFSYYDCSVDDSRLVALNAMDAHNRGAHIRTYTQCTNASFQQDSGLWHLDLSSTLTPSIPTTSVQAKVLVNAAGPWVQEFLEQKMQRRSPRKIRLIKGSHIIVPSLHTGPEAFILQNDDKRVVFVIPYRGMSLVGTTDRAHQAPAEEAAIDDYEVEYLLATINQYFETNRTRADILFTYSGVRPLCDDESDDPSAITRDYTLTLEQEPGPLLSVFGGKLTTFRKLAEAALEKLEDIFSHMKPQWTANEPLPGGNQSKRDLDQNLTSQYPWLGSELRSRFINSYGTLAYKILGESKSIEGLGALVFHDLFEKEIEYGVRHEFVHTAQDLLWRRSKLGYHLPRGDQGPERERRREIIKHIESVISESRSYD